MPTLTAIDFLDHLRRRLDNPAIDDSELLKYIEIAMLEIQRGLYTAHDYFLQVLDTACQYLFDDGKFPEVSSISQGGVTTSFAGDGPKRFKERIASRRIGAWMRKSRI